MDSFLQEQVKHIFDRHVNQEDLLWKEDITIIIPNRRAAVYIQKYLADLFKRPFFAPEILTINEWISNHSDEKILTSTELLFILYEIHQEFEEVEEQTFEEFIQWGKIVLTDFDEIDRYLISPDQLFKNLKDIKVLESWNLEDESMSQRQLEYKTLWDKLPEYYNRLEIRLKERGATYAGKAYAQFYHQLLQQELKSHYYFLGFNAVSKVEKAIMKTLIKEGKATVAFDVDQYYINNPSHEAGHFYREIRREWQLNEKIPSFFDQEAKNIQIIETSQQTTQAKIGGNIVKELLEKKGNLKSTAIVLADESLLIPLTKSLPLEIEKANITMGWPIKFSHLKGFLDIIFELQFNFKKFKTEQLYHKTIVQLIQHPYFSEIANKSNLAETIQAEITNSNQIFLDYHDLTQKDKVFNSLDVILTPWPTALHERVQLFEKIIQLLFHAFERKEEERLKIDLEILYQFDKGYRKLADIIKDYSVELSLRGFKQLFYQFWQNESVSFLGNPIDGVQVMGILETRALDFENLIVLGMNEGILPKSNIPNSFIPRDLRLFEKQLPTEEDRQAIFAHHFYRLLQRAKNVVLTYNSTSDSWTSGEKSRFIIQLENEVNPTVHTLSESVYTPDDTSANTTSVSYPSTKAVHKRLDELFERGLSPSALNKLINCPLDFYYRYILRFDEIDEVEENIESSTFGTKIHRVLEEIIQDNFKKEDGSYHPLSIDKLQQEKTDKKISKRLEKAYTTREEGNTNEKKFRKRDLKYGQNKLSFDVSKKFIHAFLKEQISELKISTDTVKPLELEYSLEGQIEIEVKGEKKQLNLRGNADRIDKKGDTYRIIDYKTGKCDKDKVSLPKDIMGADGIENFIHHDKKAYARQLMMYAILFQQNFPQSSSYTAGIISMININDWVQNVHDSKTKSDEISATLIDLFKKGIADLIESLYAEDFEFKHNPDAKYCQHCDA